MEDERSIPVLLLGYNRPELLIKRVKELLLNKVEILHISIDGCESELPDMNSTIQEIKRICEKKCDLKIINHKANLGLARHITNEITSILMIYPEVIILEDDIAITETFLSNMKNGIGVMQNMSNNGVVSGFSPLKRSKFIRIKNKWRKSPYFNCWGWACTREIWSNYILDLSGRNINEDLSKSKIWNELNKWQQHLWLSRFAKIQNTPHHTWDIQFQYMCFRTEMINVAPIFSITDNQGFNDSRGAHTKGRKPRWMAGTPPERNLIYLNASNITSLLFSKLIEPLTTSGDSRLVRLRNIIKS